MAEAKKTGTTRARKQASAPKIGPELALESVQSVVAPDTPPSPPSAAIKAPMAEPMQFSRFGADRADAVRQALSQAALATANGALEINDKIIAAVQSQSDAAIDLWRTTFNTPHLTDALRLHANGTRQAYETASAQWQDIAEATARWFHKSMEPLQAAMADRAR
ncbi:phasin family protein [Microvirga puerhi]|uniref:Phasin family protein n=1 Tax=Microvirga puerhi TaxID=2876078 RepID=A0ABS7VKW2_9HYPH|nr:phasin family protein [Microvirga puerhi]MBZ6076174.1 phasin family protein [Microvirga puerhi]